MDASELNNWKSNWLENGISKKEAQQAIYSFYTSYRQTIAGKTVLPDFAPYLLQAMLEQELGRGTFTPLISEEVHDVREIAKMVAARITRNNLSNRRTMAAHMCYFFTCSQVGIDTPKAFLAFFATLWYLSCHDLDVL